MGIIHDIHFSFVGLAVKAAVGWAVMAGSNGDAPCSGEIKKFAGIRLILTWVSDPRGKAFESDINFLPSSGSSIGKEAADRRSGRHGCAALVQRAKWHNRR